MMQLRCLFILLLVFCNAYSQKKPEDFGYRLIEMPYKDEQVKILVRSKPGDENKPKPLFFFCQGSMAQPILKYDHRGLWGVVPFDEESFLENYHIIIVGKPGIPVIADAAQLGPNYIWQENGKVPVAYSQNNYLGYYTERNLKVLEKLVKQPWVLNKRFVIAGHSEGTYVAAKMASANKKTAALILSSGNPYGRILSILAQDRYTGNDEHTLEYWENIVAEKEETESNGVSDSYKTTYSFSVPVAQDILSLKIPVLYCYGTKDWSAPYNDLLQSETIRLGIKNITFLTYRGLEHNYFPVDDKLQPDHNIYNWTTVGKDWLAWLQKTN